jgi:uncharacterized protein
VLNIQETAAGLTFAIRVQPRAKRNAIIGELGGALKVALTAPPVGGRANEACVELLAETLDVHRNCITLVSGQSSRNKVVRVKGLSAQDLRDRVKF